MPNLLITDNIKRFYDSVDHEILKETLAKVIDDDRALHLLGHVIDSFHVEGFCGKGAPIGNLTSQNLHQHLSE